MTPVVVRCRAEADIEKAKAWYARDDQQLGQQFAQEVSRTVDRIGARPDQFPEVGRGVRRALLHRFPYATYFIRREDLGYRHRGASPASATRRLEASNEIRGNGLTSHAPDGVADREAPLVMRCRSMNPSKFGP